MTTPPEVAMTKPDRVADGTVAFALEGADELERLGNAEKSLIGAIPAIVADERLQESMAFHEGEARRWYRLANAVRTLALETPAKDKPHDKE
jgi:hypothetical protein